MKTARQLCFEALLKIEKCDGYSNLVLSGILEKNNLSETDRAFLTRLFYGCIEKKLLLDYQIIRNSKRSTKSDIRTTCILRMGIYQLFFMDSVPDSAAVNESVKLCAFAGIEWAKGFVNALLHSCQRNGILYPDKSEKNYDSIVYSVSPNIISLLKGQYGEEKAYEILCAFSKPSKQYIRVNTKKTDSEKLISRLSESKIKAEKCEICENCLSVSNMGELTKLNAFSENLFFVQDLSSQRCCEALEVKNAKRILDVCASPGGKSLTLYLISGENAEIVSCDVSDNRVSLISSAKEKFGFDKIYPMINDATVYNEKLGKFDRILCDVPCSGLGVIGKKPEIRYKTEEISQLYPIQRKILETSSKYLEDDGLLVYSTCTLNKNENEKAVNEFLKAHTDFEPYESKSLGGYYKTFFPDSDGGDGFFVSVLHKKGKETAK